MEAGRDREGEIVFAVRRVAEVWKRGEVRINDILSRGIASQSGRNFFHARARARVLSTSNLSIKNFVAPQSQRHFVSLNGNPPAGTGNRWVLGGGSGLGTAGERDS